MDIYILRHAIAGDRGPKYPDDSKRPLTKDGMAKMHANALGLKALNITCDAIISSPYVRAVQTAEIVIDVLKTKHALRLSNHLTPDAAFKDLIKEINTTHKKSQRIILVGHEPHLSGLISYLLVKNDTIPVDFKKGGLCHVHSNVPLRPGCAQLIAFLSPQYLRSIKADR